MSGMKREKTEQAGKIKRTGRGRHSVCLIFSVCFVFSILTGCRTYTLDGGARNLNRPSFRGAPGHNLTGECVEGFDPSIDYFPDKITPKHARIYSVSYHSHYKVVRLNAPRTNQEENPVVDTMVLVQCGAPAPSLLGELAGATVIETPARTIAANDNIDVGFINRLGQAERLIAVGGREIYNEQIRRRWDEKKLASIGFAWHAPPNLEVVLAYQPDVLFMRRSALTQAEAMQEARRLEVKAAPTLARSEPTYLAAAEWIKYIALFLNEERRAEAAFSRVEEECTRIRNHAVAGTGKPRAIWANYEGGGFWRTARSPHDLRAHYLEDAGAINPLADEQALISGRLSTEQLLKLAGDADYWITENHTAQGWPDKIYLQQFKAYRTGRIYHHQKRTNFEVPAYDWYETGPERPDLVLKDLAALFHPELFPGHTQLFFETLKTEER
jgi:iron complex transport system substrate-binding protein